MMSFHEREGFSWPKAYKLHAKVWRPSSKCIHDETVIKLVSDGKVAVKLQNRPGQYIC